MMTIDDILAAHLLLERTPEEVLESVDRRWRIVADRFPFPRWPINCPVCGGVDIHLSRIGYGTRPESLLRRADVGFKCRDCSHYWTHGVPITDGVFKRATAVRQHWSWRQIREVLHDHGLPV